VAAQQLLQRLYSLSWQKCKLLHHHQAVLVARLEVPAVLEEQVVRAVWEESMPLH